MQISPWGVASWQCGVRCREATPQSMFLCHSKFYLLGNAIPACWHSPLPSFTAAHSPGSFLRVTILRLVVRESWRKGKKPSFMANSAHGVRTDRDLNMRIECVQCDHVTCSHSVPSVCAKRFPIWQRAKLVNVAIFSSVTFTLARTTLSALYVNASWKGIPIHVTCHVTDSFTVTSVLWI